MDGATGSTVRGTPYFMAPEIVRGEAMPSTRTDLFSLAVLLFYAFLLSHPLEGARALAHQVWDVDAMTDAFGVRPTFVFDPADDGNRPVPGASVEQDNMLACWPVCPSFLRRLFVRAFTVGLAPDGDRVRESEWRKAMVRLHDSVVFCASCGRENLADVDDDGAPVADVVAVGGQRCWSCGARLALPPRLVLASHPVVAGARHGAARLPPGRPLRLRRAGGRDHPPPRGPRSLGPAQRHRRTLARPRAQRLQSQIAPGRAVALTEGLTLAFGSGATGVVRT